MPVPVSDNPRTRRELPNKIPFKKMARATQQGNLPDINVSATEMTSPLRRSLECNPHQEEASSTGPSQREEKDKRTRRGGDLQCEAERGKQTSLI